MPAGRRTGFLDFNTIWHNYTHIVCWLSSNPNPLISCFLHRPRLCGLMLRQQYTAFYVSMMGSPCEGSSGCVLDCQVRDPRFKPRPGQKFGSCFLLNAHPYSITGTTSQWIPESVPSLELT